MKNFFSAFILLAGIAALLVSCEKEANIDVPQTDPKLVVSCFISPQDTTIIVRVNRSKPVFQASNVEPTYSVAHATVTLSGTSGSVQLTYDPTLEWYSVPAAQFPIQAGATYSLTVTTNRGEAASATTTVPANAPQNYAVTLTSELVSDNSGTRKHFTADNSWTDFAGQTDFYQLIWIKLQDDVNNPGDTLFSKFGWESMTDKNNDGGQILLTSEAFDFNMGLDSAIAIDFHLLHASEEFFRYHQSIGNYSGGNPFAEPVLIYTNINGGLGVFAGFNSVVKRVGI